MLEPTPPTGANVEFVVAADPLVDDGVGRIRMRVHERGSGETLSCGTGRGRGGARDPATGPERGAPDQWRVEVPGRRRSAVRMFPADDGEHVVAQRARPSSSSTARWNSYAEPTLDRAASPRFA